MTENKPYSEAVSTGQYAKKSGLIGKYDNVRRFWEDEVTKLFIRPYLKELVDMKTKKLERLRILDIGCGAGDGYDLLMGITAKDVGIYEYAVETIDEELLGLYMGIDINPELLKQASEIHTNNEKVIFQESNFLNGLPTTEMGFDIYFTSYGTLSHNNDKETVKLLIDITKHCDKNALVICDWLGRYSYEWQELWVKEPDKETFMDYRISYIYLPEERTRVDIQSFPLRIISGEEALNIVKEAREKSGAEIKLRKFFDRSIFVGRHMDTAEYNRHRYSVREAVNSLLEPNTRTDLNPLIIDYFPKQGFKTLNKFFEGFSMCWNTLVKHTMEFLSEFQEGLYKENGLVDTFTFYPEPLKNAVQTMKNVINSTGNLPGDARANIIEPQLAYALRKLEMDMQQGWGTGHGLVSILEINK